MNYSKAQEFYNRNIKYAELAFKDMLPYRYVLVLMNLCNLNVIFVSRKKERKDRMEYMTS